MPRLTAAYVRAPLQHCARYDDTTDPRQRVTVRPSRDGGRDVVTPNWTTNYQTKQPAVEQERQAAKPIHTPSQLVIKKQNGPNSDRAHLPCGR